MVVQETTYVEALSVDIHTWYAQNLEKKPTMPPTIRELLTQMKTYHLPTYEHMLRVGLTTLNIGQFLNNHFNATLVLAATIHDIGKLDIPREMLGKEWNLQYAERMQGHVMAGYNMLQPKSSIIAHVVVRHHQFQSNPYPNALPELPPTLVYFEKNIENMAELVALADCYDALHRENSLNGKITGAQIKQQLLTCKSAQAALIHRLYEVGIFRE